MVYIKFNEGVVSEIIPEFNPAFPQVPLSSRYPKEYISTLLALPDDCGAVMGYRYDTETNVFEAPSPVDPDTGEALEENTPTLAEIVAEQTLQIAELQAVIDAMLTGGGGT